MYQNEHEKNCVVTRVFILAGALSLNLYSMVSPPLLAISILVES
jgi:hypothetical protein